MRREAEQAERAASAAEAQEAASAEANEAAGTAKPANFLAVACDRVQARFEREEAKRTAAEAADRACRRQRPVDAMQAGGNDMPGSETLGTGLMEAAVVGVASGMTLNLMTSSRMTLDLMTPRRSWQMPSKTGGGPGGSRAAPGPLWPTRHGE